MIRSLGGELLAHLGYRVHQAPDGPQALERFLREGDIDLVILDFHLPGRSGLAVLQELKALDPQVRC